MAKILIGIPSYQEEKTMQKIAEIIDQVIDIYLKKDPVLLVNADNNLSDRTEERFSFLKSNFLYQNMNIIFQRSGKRDSKRSKIFWRKRNLVKIN